MRLFKLLLLLLLLPTLSYANFWQNLWSRPDQQGAHLLATKKPLAAAQRFKNPAWRATALYRAGKFKEASALYAKSKTPEANYNLGNALAKAGEYQKAIRAYESALKQNPKIKDAQYNLALIKKLLKQQQQKKSSKSSQPSSKQQKKPGQQKKQQHSASQNSNSAQQTQANKNTQMHKNENSPSKPHAKQSLNTMGHHPQQSSKKSKGNSAEQQNKSANDKGSAIKKINQPSPQKTSSTSNKHTTQSKSQKRQIQGKPQATTESSSQEKLQRAKLKHWLNEVPDDPGGLLRRKFLRDYQRDEEQT